MKDEIPYDELDPAMVRLCRTLNEFDGIATQESCQGFVDGHRHGKPWSVYFGFDGVPTLEGCAAIEFLVWLRREAQAAGFELELTVNSLAPYLNGVCQSMYFIIKCANRHPDELADFVRQMKKEAFLLPLQTGIMSSRQLPQK